MWIPGLDEFSRKGIKADHTPYSTMRNLTQNVICSRRDLKKINIFPARIKGLEAGARSEEGYRIVVCNLRSVVGRGILRSAFAVLTLKLPKSL